MEDIKTVALKVAREVSEKYDQKHGIKRDAEVDFDDDMKEFIVEHARMLLAELQKDATPVGEVSGNDPEMALLYRELDPGTPLYTHPKAATVPQGWKLVPVEPTQEMLKAQNWLNGESMYSEPLGYREAKSIYRAMLEAAPSLPAQSEGEQN